MSIKRKVIIILLSIALVLSMAFVIWQTLLPASIETDKSDIIIDVGTNSHDQSEAVFDATHGVIDAVFGEGNIGLPRFRKLAHVVEYFVVTLLFIFLLLACKKYSLIKNLWILSFGLFFAVIDESLQIISKRGPEVKDILFDFQGVLLAVVIFAGVYYLIKWLKHSINKRRTA